MADLQKYKKNEKNKEKSAKHRACVIIWLVTNVLSDEKNSTANCGERFCLLRRRRSVEYAAVVFLQEFVFYRIFVTIRNNTTYFKNENPDSMIRISRFFLPFLCCLTAPALAGYANPLGGGSRQHGHRVECPRGRFAPGPYRNERIGGFPPSCATVSAPTAVSGSNAVSCGRCCAPSRTIRTVR